MKLVTEMYAQAPGGGQGSLAGTKLTQAANNKASQAAQAPKAMTNTSNNVGMQQNQMAQKQGNVKAMTVQKQGGAPAKAATTGSPMSTVEYFDALRARKEFNKHLTEKKSDWKKELTEALGGDDEVFHPYVEVMPFKDFKQNEAKKNLAGQAVKAGAAENPAQVKAKAGMMGMTGMAEQVYSQPHGDERKKREKAEKEKKAQAAKDAVRHARLTKGIPGYDEKGKYHLKDGKKIYEERKDEKGLSDNEKSIGRSLLAGLNPVDDHMAGATRQRLALAARGKKKRKGRK